MPIVFLIYEFTSVIYIIKSINDLTVKNTNRKWKKEKLLDALYILMTLLLLPHILTKEIVGGSFARIITQSFVCKLRLCRHCLKEVKMFLLFCCVKWKYSCCKMDVTKKYQLANLLGKFWGLKITLSFGNK